MRPAAHFFSLATLTALLVPVLEVAATAIPLHFAQADSRQAEANRLFEQGILPLYTLLSGRWLTMAESNQRILKRRALDGQHPETPQQIIERFEPVAKGWNQ